MDKAIGGEVIPVELNMPVNLGNSAVATGLQKTSFHSNNKEGQCQRMFKLFTCQQGNAQNPSSQASIVCELRTSRCAIWIQKSQRNQRSNCHLLDHRKSKGLQKNICFIGYAKAFDCVGHSKLWIILKEMGIPDHLTCFLRKLYAGQEATVRTGQQSGSKSGKEYVKPVYCHPNYLAYKQTTLCEVSDWMKQKLESRLPGEMSITLDTHMTPP